jgi:hypothetical protein
VSVILERTSVAAEPIGPRPVSAAEFIDKELRDKSPPIPPKSEDKIDPPIDGNISFTSGIPGKLIPGRSDKLGKLGIAGSDGRFKEGIASRASNPGKGGIPSRRSTPGKSVGNPPGISLRREAGVCSAWDIAPLRILGEEERILE